TRQWHLSLYTTLTPPVTSTSNSETPAADEQSNVCDCQITFLPGLHTTYPPCAAMPTSANPSPSKSAMVGAPPIFDSTAQSEAVLAGSGMGFSSMPPVQSWMRKNPRLATTICGCLSSGRTPIGKP